jgi:hypothetical protein
MQITTLVNNAHLLFIVADDLNEVTHDIRKESYTSKHNHNRNDSLVITDWIVVTITHCTECSKSVVATDNELMGLIFLVQMILLDKGIWLSFVVNITEHEPYTSNEISYNDSNNDKSEDLVNIQHHVLGHYLLVS